MKDGNDVVIEPEDDITVPQQISVDQIKAGLAVVINFLKTVSNLMPGKLGESLGKIVTALETLQSMDWLLSIIATILGGLKLPVFATQKEFYQAVLTVAAEELNKK